MEQWSGEQRAFVVKSYYKNNCVVADQQHFQTYFQIRRHGRVPLARAIKEWVRKFEQTGSANNVKHKGPKKSVRTPENIDRVRASVEPSPKRSIRKRAQALRIYEKISSGLQGLRLLFFGGYLKQKVFVDKPRTIQELQIKIIEEIANIPLDMLHSAMENFHERLRECMQRKGGHLPGIIFKK
ncbi:hypothetical protein ILUMI_14858 [Ignelater luminosus]|uniref:DUF4817 domain-containing protein n=1 Tax=Ignelater luminosus TaxID=2038154 RepID=A0A8K0G4F9_IGNLU|nr:hypothetical protein ILUMI_14858 [Ignelater luminosus]